MLYVLELFAGGGGLSHICRQSGDVEIRAGWANDINQSACATYNCNEPEAYVSTGFLGQVIDVYECVFAKRSRQLLGLLR